MIGWERRVLLRHYLEQGMTKTELAERFGISRQTIYRWIRSGELDRDLSAAGVHYSARAPVATKLDRYRDILVSRLGEYPDLTAVRLFEEIKAAGYAGGYTQVKEYVRKVRPRAPEEPVVRFETPPGHQGQVDFADFRLPWGKRSTHRSLAASLSYRQHTRQQLPHAQAHRPFQDPTLASCGAEPFTPQEKESKSKGEVDELEARYLRRV